MSRYIVLGEPRAVVTLKRVSNIEGFERSVKKLSVLLNHLHLDELISDDILTRTSVVRSVGSLLLRERS